MDLNLCQGQCLLFALVCGGSFASAVLWGSCPHLSHSFWLVWLGSAGWEILQEKAATQLPHQDVLFPWVICILSFVFVFYSVLQGTPARWRDFHSATIIGTKMYVFGGRADRFGPFHSNNEIYCNRIEVFDTETNSWLDFPPTPVLPEGRRSHSACECGSAEGGGWWKETSACLGRGVCSAGWGCGLARGAQSPISVESCCPPKSLAHHTARKGDVSRGGQPAPLCFVFDVGSGSCWVAL